MRKLTATVAATFFALTAAQASEFDAPLQTLAQSELSAIAARPEILAAVAAQNAANADIAQARIDELDKEWRAEAATGGPLVDRVLGNETSALLRRLQEQSGGIYTEVFVTDNVGLNVGQSGVTSDYWQGDEAKWQVPFNQKVAHFSDVELDESTQTYQAQVSLPVMDEGGHPIGAVTFGINVEMLMQ